MSDMISKKRSAKSGKADEKPVEIKESGHDVMWVYLS